MARPNIRVLAVNIQCLFAHLAELALVLEVHKPHVALIQETWLDSSSEQVTVGGYVQVSRRDRNTKANRGGILTLQRQDFNGLVHIADSPDEERSWHFLRIGIETLRLCNWYRSSSCEHDEFEKNPCGNALALSRSVRCLHGRGHERPS